MTRKKIRVLLADDSAILRQCVSEFLEKFPDIEIAGEACNGKLAVKLAKQLVPDLVVMDIGMPEMNGIEATRAIHRSLPKVKVIGLSISDDADYRKAMQQAGALAFVSKLKFSSMLIDAIRTCFPARHNEVELAR